MHSLRINVCWKPWHFHNYPHRHHKIYLDGQDSSQKIWGILERHSWIRSGACCVYLTSHRRNTERMAFIVFDAQSLGILLGWVLAEEDTSSSRDFSEADFFRCWPGPFSLGGLPSATTLQRHWFTTMCLNPGIPCPVLYNLTHLRVLRFRCAKLASARSMVNEPLIWSTWKRILPHFHTNESIFCNPG